MARLAGVAALACLAPGCGASQPQVDTSVPEVKPAEAPDPDAPLPKGMPDIRGRNMQIDPATGRPIGPPPGS